MDKLTELYELLQEEEIYLKNHEIETYKATTINMKNEFAIFVDFNKIETLEDEFCVIAHETGHCMTGTTHKLNSPLELIEKQEYKASKYAVNKFLPLEDIQEALNLGYKEFLELSEYFSVPLEFVELSYEIYSLRGLLPERKVEQTNEKTT